MEGKIIQEDLNVLRKHKTAKKVYALLFKEELSVKELAERIYNNKRNRHEITKWIKYFLKKRWITPVISLTHLSEKKYKSNLNPFISKFTQKEIQFIEIFLQRFWNPLRTDPERAFNEILLEALIVKKIYKIRGKLGGYNPKKDLESYRKNKSKFWDDETYRSEFLNKISKKGNNFERRNMIKIPATYTIHDYFFMCLLIPDSILIKLEGGHKIIGNPLFLVTYLLDY